MPGSKNPLGKLHSLDYPQVTRIQPLAYYCLSVSRLSPSFGNYVFYPSSHSKFNCRFRLLTAPCCPGPGRKRYVFKHSSRVKGFPTQSGNEVSPRTTLLYVKSARPPILRSSLTVHQSIVGNLPLALVIGVLAGAYLFCIFDLFSQVELVRSSADSEKLEIQDKDLTTSCRIDWPDMTGEILPGRPGNLTSEQEEKLREIWIAALRVFGVLDSFQRREVGGWGRATLLAESQKFSDQVTPERTKKKRISIFGRKHKDNDNESVVATDPTSPALPADLDDKYGQTKQFHETLARQTPESLRAAFWSMAKHDHPDALLLRFLRARKWDVEKALIMMVSTMNWRSAEMHVDDDIMRLGEEGSWLAAQSPNQLTRKSGEDFLTQMRMGKSYLHGVDKSGRPMCFVRARLHKQGEQTEESLERYTVFVIESARMLLAPPIDTACIIFDMTGFSLANMDYSPVKFMIKCFEANYPESLGVVLVHKAPWVFQGIWKIIKGWLDPVVASKVNFTNNIDEMEEFVSRNHIPKDLGGDEDWAYEYVEPLANENEQMKDVKTRDRLLAKREILVREYEKATLDWIDYASGPDVAAVMEERRKLAMNLREDYWRLDGYVRARSLYDRIGMIQPGGRIEFYPTVPIGSSPAIANGTYEVETSAEDVD